MDEKISKAVEKRQELVSTFVTKTKENLDAKMEESQEKREAHLSSLKTKLKEHVCRLLFRTSGPILTCYIVVAFLSI